MDATPNAEALVIKRRRVGLVTFMLSICNSSPRRKQLAKMSGHRDEH